MFKKRTVAASSHRKRSLSDAAGHADIVRSSRPSRARTVSSKDEDVSDDEGAAAAVFASNRTTEPVAHRGGAFEHSEIDTATDRDAQAMRDKARRVAANKCQLASYGKSDKFAPARAPQFVRNTCRFDYQPDVCKDYKDTGFCGYGDSCKFMHDRGDYKTGWQLEAEYRRQKERDKEREMLGRLGEDDDDKDTYRVRAVDDLPFACHLCRGPFEDPTQTTCGHLFCAGCATAHFRQGNTNCPVCDKPTAGVLNAAPARLRALAKSAGGYDALFRQRAAAASASDDADVDEYQRDKAAASFKKNMGPTIRAPRR